MPEETMSEAAGKSGNFPPLDPDFYPDCTIIKAYGYRAIKKPFDGEEGDEYVATLLDIVIDPHVKQAINGEEVDRYVTIPFLTLSTHKKANLRAILDKLGFGLEGDKPNPSIAYEFDSDEYEGMAFRDLPVYPGKGSKEGFTVPLKFFKVNGRDIIGQHISVELDTKGDYNRVVAYVTSRKPPVKVKTTTAPEKRHEVPSDSWTKQEQAISWAQAQTRIDGTPLFATDDDLRESYKALYNEYTESLLGDESPDRQEFYRHWYSAVEAWKVEGDYSVIPFK